jgi:hypothetical protein
VVLWSLVTAPNLEPKPKKNNFNPNKIERHIAYIDARLDEYNAILAKEDGDVHEKQSIAKKIKKHSIKQKIHWVSKYN